jgi:hypothetical protein
MAADKSSAIENVAISVKEMRAAVSVHLVLLRIVLCALHCELVRGNRTHHRALRP